MKRYTWSLALLLFCLASNAQVKEPAPSPKQTITQAFGLGEIELVYSRPSLRGRKMIGVVEPWDSVWRTGANEATKITFTDTVEIGGKKINPGSYALYTIPHKDGNWDFILNSGAKNWGAYTYSKAADVLRIKIKASKNLHPVETLTMQFSDVKNESINLNIKWEDFGLQIPIKTQIKERIRTALERALQGDDKPYWQAAQFYYEYDKNYKKALEMVDARLKSEKNPAYFLLFYKARIQKDAGDKAGALQTAQTANKLAKADQNANYTIMSQQMIDELQ